MTIFYLINCFCFNLELYHFHFCRQADCFVRMLHIWSIARRSNYVFVKNRSVHNYNTRNKDKLRPAIAKHLYRDRDFRLVGVHVWNYICDNINIDTLFASFKRILKKFIQSEKFIFYLI